MIGAWSSEAELFAAQTYEHTVNKGCFITYKKECPSFKGGMAVIAGNIGNAPWHKGQEIRDIIEATGAILIYLPPYSELNPIKHAWANPKAAIKSAKIPPRK